MKKVFLAFLALGFASASTFGQKHNDSVFNRKIDEVIIVSNPVDGYENEGKSLGSLDDYLERSNSINMVRRGAYAFEPMLNGMSSERSVITLEGMRIYQACTDKMDPVTSYIENTNLSKAEIKSGALGNAHGGAIAGGIDLYRRKTGFTNTGTEHGGTLFAGFEHNNKQQIYGFATHYSHTRFFADLDFTYRNAENYFDGKGNEILYSQFSKYNVSAVAGYKIDKHQYLEASLIFDDAHNVGYPALTMDVGLARAFIGSLQYSYHKPFRYFDLWETKAYFNSITHIMDDSYRPDVPIRMDMPGWSKTSGLYSKIEGKEAKHSYSLTLSGHLNNSLAEMTMYPNVEGEKEMFMLTWPDVNTSNLGLYAEDKMALNEHWQLKIGGGFIYHQNKIIDSFGLKSNKVFYPDMTADKDRLLKNIASQMAYHHGDFMHTLTLGYADRAPSISEAYGFYLFNSFDGWDYMGNPFLKNEQSFNMAWSSHYQLLKFQASATLNYFHISNYIIGKPDPTFLPMTIGANGVKVYTQLPFASLLNADLNFNYYLGTNWTLNAKASYRLGQDNQGDFLPLIQPFSYRLHARYEWREFFVEASLNGNAAYSRYNPEFGESAKPSFQIVDISLSKDFHFSKTKLIAKVGVENLFNAYYIAFSDWNNIPRMGRNVFGNLIYKF